MYQSASALEGAGGRGRFLGFLNLLFSSGLTSREKKEILQKEYGFSFSLDEGREMEEMCNLSQGILQEGIAQNLFRKGMSIEDITEVVSAKKEQIEKWVLQISTTWLYKKGCL